MTFGSEILNRQEDIEEFGQNGNEAIARLADYVRRRATLAEDYAKGLQKLNRQFHPAVEHEFGLGDLLQAADKVCTAHLRLVEGVHGPVLDGLKAAAREHDRGRRETLSEVRTSRAAWRKQMAVFEKVRKAKDAAIRAAEEARLAFERANNDKNVTKAYVERLRDEYAVKARRTLVTKEEYIQAAQYIRTQQRVFYDEELPQLFDRLHQAEETRLTRIRTHLREFGNLLAATVIDEAACYNALLNKWEALVPAHILQQFIDELRGNGPFVYPEEIVIDECAGNECLGVVKLAASVVSEAIPQLSRQASRLLLCQDSEVIKARVVELEREIPAMAKKHEGVRNLHQLYEAQPELADEATRVEAAKQVCELATSLASLQLEKGQLEKKLDTEQGLPSTASLPGSPVLWEDPNPDQHDSEGDILAAAASFLPSVQSPRLSAIEPSTGGEEKQHLAARAMAAKALFDFEALDEAYEVSVQQGQELTILSKDGEWCQVELADGRTGYVPYNYIQEGGACS